MGGETRSSYTKREGVILWQKAVVDSHFVCGIRQFTALYIVLDLEVKATFSDSSLALNCHASWDLCMYYNSYD